MAASRSSAVLVYATLESYMCKMFLIGLRRLGVGWSLGNVMAYVV